MKRCLIAVCMACSGAIAVAGTQVPVIPEPTVSAVDVTIDTLQCGTAVESVDRLVDTLLWGWGLSPYPGIYINSKPLVGFSVLIR